MWHSFFNNMMTLIGVVFIAFKFNDYLLENSNMKNIKPWGFAILASFLVILMMCEPFRINEMNFDLRSVPIFFISYVWGLKIGLITGIMPTLFRIYIGGTIVRQGIIYEILLPIIIGSLFSKSEKKKLSNGLFNVERVLFAYSFQYIAKMLFNFYKFPVSMKELIITNITMIIFSMLALYCIVLFINDYKRNKYLIMQTYKKQKEIESLNRELNRINNTLYALINVMPIGVKVVDIQGNTTLLNTTAESILKGGGVQENRTRNENGYSLYKIDGTPLLPEENPLLKAIENGKTQKDREVLIRYENGEEKFVLAASSPIYEEDNNIVGIVGVFLDITNRKILEQNVEWERRIKNALVNSIDEIMILTDIRGNIITSNETFAKQLGMRVEEVIGFCTFDLIPFRLSENYKIRVDKVIKTKELARFEEKINERYFNITIYPVLDKCGDVVNLSVISQDITKLKEASEMKNRFIANVSHELKTPLNITMTYLEFLLEEQEGDLNAEQREIIETAYNNAERLKYLINDLLKLSLFEAHKVKFDFVSTNICKFLKALIKDRRILIKNKNLSIIIDIPKKDIFIITDVLRLREVIDNILDNAVKFSEDGDIQVSLEEKVDNIEISIKDHGIGIDTNKIKEIFTPFFQCDDTLKKKYKGVGLGLSIAKKIIAAMGGNILVNNNIDKGCCFKITIPFDCSAKEETDEKNIYC